MNAKPASGENGATKALYQRIRSDLETRITSGDWPPGYRVPFEHELMETYSCSRMTVNKVISALAEAGLVVRRRRAGSFVSRPRVQSAILQIPDLKGEVEKRGETEQPAIEAEYRKRFEEFVTEIGMQEEMPMKNPAESKIQRRQS